MHSILLFCGVLAAALGASLHHEVGHHDTLVHHVTPVHHQQVVPPHLVIMQHMQQVLHHHVEPLVFVYPVNTRAYTAQQLHAPHAAVGTSASCTLAPSSPEGLVRGLVTLHQLHPGAPVLVSGSVEGLTPGPHGFHLHRDGKTGDMCKEAGPHFNPANSTHGGPSDSSRHAGDFGNIDADLNGSASVSFAAHGISLVPGAPDSVLQRAFVVHAKPDDLGRGRDAESLKTGNAGARVACCVVTAHH